MIVYDCNRELPDVELLVSLPYRDDVGSWSSVNNFITGAQGNQKKREKYEQIYPRPIFCV